MAKKVSEAAASIVRWRRKSCQTRMITYRSIVGSSGRDRVEAMPREYRRARPGPGGAAASRVGS
ncbi:hypothetical protein FFA01_12160 [Frigoribacterium faeni]|uniref:Uncharacterized protein n=1 Tax=Frigoribacterium faeni TaxID=145483 RepID=A0ABQ0UN57_9MICO|nr:hypothetical protein GCM10025699_57690 [Microbacterium flavescens]GEK82907.1 hypothetical protein FFA01_12160 [Frigoribacterium faeni]